MPKVLHLRASGQLLGAERVVLELSTYLPNFGYESLIGIPVETSHPDPEFLTSARESGYTAIKLPIDNAFDLSVTKKIREYIKDNNIDIIHSHGYREDLYAIMARSSAKLVATNHLWKRTNIKLKIYAALDALLLKKFDSVIAVSKPVKQEMLTAGIRNEKISVISNGIDASKFSIEASKSTARTSLNLPQDAKIIGSISSLSKEKGLNYLIDAAAQVIKAEPQLHLFIVGDGEERANLQEQADSLGLTHHVTFAGRRKDIPQILAALDVFALPSLNEGLPMSLLEAMAAGKAVIASDVGDVSVVVREETGLLVKATNIDQLATSILSLLQDPSKAGTLSENAKNYITENYSALAMARQYAAIYNQLMNTNPLQDIQ